MGQVKDVIKDPESIRDGAEASMARSYEQGRVSTRWGQENRQEPTPKGAWGEGQESGFSSECNGHSQSEF